MPNGRDTALHEMMLDLAAQEDLSICLERTVELAAALLDVPVSGIYLYEQASDEWRASAMKGCRTAPFGTCVPAQQGIPGQAAERCEIVVATMEKDAASFAPGWTDRNIQAVIAVPLGCGSRAVGVLFAGTTGDPATLFGAEEQRLIQLFAVQAGSTIYHLDLLERVRSGRTRVQYLSRRLLQIHEMEGYQIGRQLQDDIGQAVASVQLNLQILEPVVSEPFARAALERSKVTLERTLEQLRELALNLRPSLLDDFGLVAALRWLIQRQSKATGMDIEFASDPLQPRPPVEVETICFRVVQQVLLHVARRGQAHWIRVELARAGTELALVIRYDSTEPDPGTPEATGSTGLGLPGLQERVILVGGQFGIESTPEQGTSLRASFPITAENTYVERRARRRNGK